MMNQYKCLLGSCGGNYKGMDDTTAAKDPFGLACSACACSISRASFLWSLGKNRESVRLSSNGVNRRTELHPFRVQALNGYVIFSDS